MAIPSESHDATTTSPEPNEPVERAPRLAADAPLMPGRLLLPPPPPRLSDGDLLRPHCLPQEGATRGRAIPDTFHLRGRGRRKPGIKRPHAAA